MTESAAQPPPAPAAPPGPRLPRLVLVIGRKQHGKTPALIQEGNRYAAALPNHALVVVNPQGDARLRSNLRVLPADLSVCRRRILLIDEIGKFEGSRSIPPSLRDYLYDLEQRDNYLLASSRRLGDQHPDLKGQVDVLVCFGIIAESDTEALRSYTDRATIDRIKALPPLRCIRVEP